MNFVIAANDYFLKYICSYCNAIFKSRNQFFKHFRQQCWKDANNVLVATSPSTTSFVVTSQLAMSAVTSSPTINNRHIVQSKIKPDVFKNNTDYAFRNWHYAISKIKISIKNNVISTTAKKNICLNFDCFVILNNR